MLESASRQFPRSPRRHYRFRHVLRVLVACSFPAAARELLARWRFVSRKDPPSWLLNVPFLATALFEIALIHLAGSPKMGPWRLYALHAWLDRHDVVATLSIFFGWMVVMWATFEISWLAANAVLLIGQPFCFPILLIIRSARRLVGCWRVLRGVLDALGDWLTPEEAIRICGQIMLQIDTAEALRWNRLSPVQAISRWLELCSSDWLKRLPSQAWSELVVPDLSPAAMAILFRRSLWHDGRVSRAVTAAVISQEWFAHPQRKQLLVRELAALPIDRLAVALELIGELSRLQYRHTISGVLAGVQELGDVEAVHRFQGAIILVSVQTCEDAVQCR